MWVCVGVWMCECGSECVGVGVCECESVGVWMTGKVVNLNNKWIMGGRTQNKMEFYILLKFIHTIQFFRWFFNYSIILITNHLVFQ